ncbi:MAG: ankyrin repeat domain-containing protein [Polyangiaceae bacterium]|nr:ankyrin repeat domain-containing protein [Polyangiaceae bacterium]
MSELSNELVHAIQTRDVDRAAALLVAGANPNEPGRSRYGNGGDLPPLHAAIAELEALDAIDPYEGEPEGPIDLLVLLLRYGAKVKGWEVDKEGDPLLDAVGTNRADVVRMVLAAGADPNVENDEGVSPLRACAEKGSVEIARTLLLCGAAKTINQWGGPGAMTALGLAVRGLHVEMVKLLLAYGADPRAKDVDGLDALDCLPFADIQDNPTHESRVLEIREALRSHG